MLLFGHFVLITGLALMIKSIFASSLLYLLAGIIIVLLSANLILHKGIGSIDIFSPLFIATMTFVVSCSVGAILYYNQLYFSENILNLSLLYIIIFTIFFMSGFLSPIGNIFSKNLPKLKSDFSRTKLKLVTVVFLPTGLFLFFFMMYRAGFANFFEVFKNLILFRKFWSQQGYAYVVELSLFLIQAPFWGWILKRNNPIKLNMPLTIYLFLILTVTLLTGRRSSFLLIFIGMIFFYHCKVKMISPFKAFFLVTVFFIPLSAFYVIMGIYRVKGGEIDQLIQLTQNINLSVAALAFIRRFTVPMEGFTDILLHSDRLNLLWGRSFYDMLFMPIPRAFMPEKPYLFSTQILWKIYPETKGKFFASGFSIMGEFYMNFHIAGLIIGGFIFGVIIKTMQKYYVANKKNISFIFLYRQILFLPMGWISSGLINSEANAFLILHLVFSSIFFILVWPKKKRISR